jgi:hypothetical protein
MNRRVVLQNEVTVNSSCFKIPHPLSKIHFNSKDPNTKPKIRLRLKNRFISKKKRKKRKQKYIPGIQKSKFKPTVPDKISTLHLSLRDVSSWQSRLVFDKTQLYKPGSILSEKLAFLKPSISRVGFLFFLFLLKKNCVGSVVASTPVFN